jgi:hypothetical protein
MRLDLQRPHQVYKLKNGKRVPGVTTILGVLSKPQLLRWYAAMEREGVLEVAHEIDRGNGIPTADAIEVCLPHPNEKGEPVYFAEVRRDKAASLGTITHARIEAWMTGEELDAEGLPPDLYAQSVHGFDRFRQWFEAEGYTREGSESEVQVVSEELQCGGTGDHWVYGQHSGWDYLDIKTSKASRYWPYADTKGQCSTYPRIYHEARNKATDRVWIVRVGTTPDDIIQPYLMTDDERLWGKKLFEAARAAYTALRELE